MTGRPSSGRGLRDRGFRRRPFVAFLVALGAVVLTALVSISVINAVRISLNVSSVQTSIAAVEPLAGYPVSARYDRRTANVVVEGLVPDAASAGLLETTLQARHPRLSLHFVLSNITTDAVRPSLRTARVEREANSVSVASLRDAGSIRDAMIMDLEARVRALQADLRAARTQWAAASFPAVTYDLDPDLGAERDRVGALLVEGRLLEGLIAPVSAEDGFEMLDGAGAAARRAEISPRALQVVSAMLVGFDQGVGFTDIRLANAATAALARVLEAQHPDARLELLAVARPVEGEDTPDHVGFFMGSKMRALLIAQGVSPSRIILRRGGRAAAVPALDAGDWRHSHFLGFRLVFADGLRDAD